MDITISGNPFAGLQASDLGLGCRRQLEDLGRLIAGQFVSRGVRIMRREFDAAIRAFDELNVVMILQSFRERAGDVGVVRAAAWLVVMAAVNVLRRAGILQTD